MKISLATIILMSILFNCPVFTADIGDMEMKEIVEYLQKNNPQDLATIGLDGKPKIRPFQMMFEEDGKLWFCTSNRKEVYRELQKQPYIELCVSGENMSWLRLGGKAVFTDDLKMKEIVFEVSPLVKGIYKEPDNPSFEVFYLEEVTATIADLSGNPPKTYAQ